MSAARVILIEDSLLVCRVLSALIEQDQALRLVSTASTGITAVEALERAQPDVVVLGTEFPGGLELSRRIRSGWPRLPILLCSKLTEGGADLTIRALAAGASDYVSRSPLLSRSASSFGAELLGKLRRLTGRG